MWLGGEIPGFPPLYETLVLVAVSSAIQCDVRVDVVSMGSVLIVVYTCIVSGTVWSLWGVC